MGGPMGGQERGGRGKPNCVLGHKGGQGAWPQGLGRVLNQLIFCNGHMGGEGLGDRRVWDGNHTQCQVEP